MNDPRLDPAYPANNPAGAPGTPEENRSGQGISAFAVLVGVTFILMVAFFGMSLVAAWKRSERRITPPAPVTAPAPPEPPRESPVRLPVVARKAIVKVPPERKHGILRATPGGEIVVAWIPNGTLVDVGLAATAPGKSGPQTWYEVKAVVDGRLYQGYMHSDILEMQP